MIRSSCDRTRTSRRGTPSARRCLAARLASLAAPAALAVLVSVGGAWAAGPMAGPPSVPLGGMHVDIGAGGMGPAVPRAEARPGSYGRGHGPGGRAGAYARRFYAPAYWTHSLPAAPVYAIATRPGYIGMIVAPVMINGRGPFRFMLDTGATRTVLASATVAKLALTINPADRIRVRGVSGVTTVPVVRVSSVSSGALQIHDLRAPVLSGPVFDGIDGILGMDGLGGMKLSADFVRDQVLISASPAATATASAPMVDTLRGRFVSKRLLLVEGRINGVLTAAVIDTGATHSLGNQALLALLAHGRATAAPSARNGVIDATATAGPGTVRRIASLRFGDTDITNLQVIFGNYPVFKTWGLQGKPALLLGMDVLGTVADFSIDYSRAELQVLPWPSASG